MSLDEDPEDSTFSEILDLQEARSSWNMRVSCPAKITKYDSETQMASVQPLLKTFYFDEENEEQIVIPEPIINCVPVIFPWGMLADLPVGHVVLLVFCDRSLDTWLVGGGMTEPIDERSHDLNDAICFPGLLDFGHPRKKSDYQAVTLSGVLTTFLTDLKTALATGTTSAGPVTFSTPLPAIPSLGSSVLLAKK